MWWTSREHRRRCSTPCDVGIPGWARAAQTLSTTLFLLLMTHFFLVSSFLSRLVPLSFFSIFNVTRGKSLHFFLPHVMHFSPLLVWESYKRKWWLSRQSCVVRVSMSVCLRTPTLTQVFQRAISGFTHRRSDSYALTKFSRGDWPAWENFRCNIAGACNRCWPAGRKKRKEKTKKQNNKILSSLDIIDATVEKYIRFFSPFF